MIQKKIALVIGAGASAPYGFPTGEALIDAIMQLSPEYVIKHPGFADDGMSFAFDNSFLNHALEEFQQILWRAKPPSIDAFLTSNPQFAAIAKPAIAAALIPCESEDTLLRVTPDEDWYLLLRNEMGTKKADFSESATNLFIITFNYDRSLEYYFKTRLCAFHGEQEGLELFKKMNILHVYGELAKPHFLPCSDKTVREYNPRLTHIEVAKCIPEIKIISESQDDSIELQKAWSWIAHADTLCFIDFGYDPTNIQRLRISEYFKGGKILGSCKGFTGNELGRISRRFPGNIRKSAITVAESIRFGDTQHRARDFLRNNDVFD